MSREHPADSFSTRRSTKLPSYKISLLKMQCWMPRNLKNGLILFSNSYLTRTCACKWQHLTQRIVFDHYELLNCVIENKVLCLEHLAKVHCHKTYSLPTQHYWRDVRNSLMVKSCLILSRSQIPASQTKFDQMKQEKMPQATWSLVSSQKFS